MLKYNPETKRQSLKWHIPALPRPKNDQTSKSRVKNNRFLCRQRRGGSTTNFYMKGKQ